MKNEKNIEIITISVPEGKIKDYIDGTFRKDTQEEYVRQNILKRLVNELGYPKELIKVEFGMKIGSNKPRIDIAIFPKDYNLFEQEKIKIIIECKKENIKPSDRKEGIEQLKSYISSCANSEWGMWTNGKDKEVFRKIANSKGEFEFFEYSDIPAFDTDIHEDDRPKRGRQRKAVADNLLFTFKRCHNFIYAFEGFQKQPAFFELLKVIFCKIEDEKNVLSDIEFFVTPKERNSRDGQLSVGKRIDKIFKKVKDKYKLIFEENDKINFKDPRTLAFIVGELQDYDLLKTNIDVKGKAYEEIVGANLRGDRGEFFTPRNVMKMTVEMINPKPNEKVLDSSCGTGGFLVQAMNSVIQQIELKIEKQFNKPKGSWTEHERQIATDLIRETAANNFFGFDINPDLVKATKMNMVMNNDGSGNIMRCNSLLPPHEWDYEFKKDLADAFGINSDDITNHNKIGLFDIVITNPPFGSKIPIIDQNILSQFQIAGNSKSVPPEQLFVERCVQFLKPGGRLGIVLPDSILGAPGLGHIRKWLFENTKIIASVDLHADTFQPRNGTQTSVLIVQKKTDEEKFISQHENYEVFMAIVEHVGHDKRGNTMFKRDNNGEILYFKNERINDIGGMEITEEPEIDDQTSLVPSCFEQWKKQQGMLW
jgi:type I restriction enzyme M protein